ncbi:MAG: outer membrane lipoprotein-sorting protein [Parcubacteria group bacterium]|jgi:hypothetical protein|nr:outer membrane lipoprotein-sorting protein [Parcubacteria group bacterium]|tara:strand:+ start:10187 stop:10978 length:792 start_codon:yes stop_codon:yes gene_type:complete
MSKVTTAWLIIITFGTIVMAQENSLTVEQIVRQANQVMYSQGENSRANAKMTITNRRGRTRLREFVVLRQDKDEQGDEQNFFVYFSSPSEVLGTALLTWKHGQRADDRWLYLPALDVVRRIAATNERSSFVGSNFFYEDITGRSIEADSHQLSETTDLYYIVNSRPKQTSSVEFDSYQTWIHRESLVPVKLEFSKSNKVYRTVETLAVAMLEGYQTVTQIRITDVKSGGYTVIEYLAVTYDLDLDDGIFSEQSLRNPPAIGKG